MEPPRANNDGADEMSDKDQPGMTYDEFVQWAVLQLFDALITGGFAATRDVFKHTVMNVLCMNIKTILPQFFKGAK